ncbi:MAG: NAD(+)/NADH kinase, partial [Nitrososphaerales archaeon]
ATLVYQKPIRVAGLISKEGLDKELIADIVSKFVKAGIQTYTIEDFRSEGALKVEDVDELKKLSPDVVVSVGGDGTLLRTLRLLHDGTPVLAINVGHRGILSEIKPEELDDAIAKLKRGEYILDRRMRIAAESSIKLPPATNEIYVVRRRHIGTPRFTIKIGEASISIKMDGVIVATPTGSTGHAYSLKGPVLQENLEAILIVPASPLQNIPPIVITPQLITIKADQPTDIVVDGQEIQQAEEGEEVRIFRCKYDANLVRFKNFILKQLLKMVT